MSPIDALKTTGQIPVKLSGSTAKVKTETAPETGAFLKLLSSVSNEENAQEPAAPAELLAKLEEALESLDAIPLEELPPEQQELLAAMIELLTLQTAQQKIGMAGQNPDYVKPETGSPAQNGPATENHAVNAQLQQKMVELMHQIAQKVQDLQSNTNKEFAVVPIFMGVKKEYILNEPKKVNETIKLLQEVVADLEKGHAQEGHAAAAKILGEAGDGLKTAAGIAAALESALPVPKMESPPVKHLRMQTEQAALQTSEAPAVRLEAVQAETPAAPLEAPKAIQPSARTEAPAPTVRMTNLADDLSGIMKNTIKLTGSGENAQIKVSIFPEHLGHLEIRLSTVDGKMAAQIFTSNMAAKEALDLQVYQLRNSLVQQGITVDRIEISQQGTGTNFSQQSEQRFAQQQQRQQATTKNGYQRLEEETAAFVRPAPSAGTVISVDYTI
ncbi:flagellar hook-length control protein FliK [Planococcus sp. FY231025]|uniref:flagellar hook-length control protein FliK n=1 Tax=Planococcus sp. FY231025 TaxID=3455699 RepID=UPI003F8E20D8